MSNDWIYWHRLVRSCLLFILIYICPRFIKTIWFKFVFLYIALHSIYSKWLPKTESRILNHLQTRNRYFFFLKICLANLMFWGMRISFLAVILKFKVVFLVEFLKKHTKKWLKCYVAFTYLSWVANTLLTWLQNLLKGFFGKKFGPSRKSYK